MYSFSIACVCTLNLKGNTGCALTNVSFCSPTNHRLPLRSDQSETRVGRSSDRTQLLLRLKPSLSRSLLFSLWSGCLPVPFVFFYRFSPSGNTKVMLHRHRLRKDTDGDQHWQLSIFKPIFTFFLLLLPRSILQFFLSLSVRLGRRRRCSLFVNFSVPYAGEETFWGDFIFFSPLGSGSCLSTGMPMWTFYPSFAAAAAAAPGYTRNFLFLCGNSL